jgi:hypothetical protein
VQTSLPGQERAEVVGTIGPDLDYLTVEDRIAGRELLANVAGELGKPR